MGETDPPALPPVSVAAKCPHPSPLRPWLIEFPPLCLVSPQLFQFVWVWVSLGSPSGRTRRDPSRPQGALWPRRVPGQGRPRPSGQRAGAGRAVPAGDAPGAAPRHEGHGPATSGERGHLRGRPGSGRVFAFRFGRRAFWGPCGESLETGGRVRCGVCSLALDRAGGRHSWGSSMAKHLNKAECGPGQPRRGPSLGPGPPGVGGRGADKANDRTRCVAGDGFDSTTNFTSQLPNSEQVI